MTETLSEKLLGKFREEELREQLRECSESIGACRYPNVFRIGKQVIAKTNPMLRLQTEFDIATLLFSNGIRVPEMYGLIEARTPKRQDYYILMQEIQGKDLRDIPEEDREEANRQFRREILKVLRMKIKPDDCSYGGNAIFSEDRKLYLIDFEFWEVGIPDEDLKPYFNMVQRSIPQQ